MWGIQYTMNIFLLEHFCQSFNQSRLPYQTLRCMIEASALSIIGSNMALMAKCM